MPYNLDTLLKNHDLLIPCCIKYYNLTENTKKVARTVTGQSK